MTPSLSRALPVSGLAVATVFALAACGDDSAAGDGGNGGDVQVVASFYPLEFVSAAVGGDHVSVSNLTPPGAEPHDLEMSPQQAAEIVDADLVVYLHGFQPEVDETIDQNTADTALDVTTVTPLEDHGSGAEHEDEHEHADEHADEGGEEHAHEDELGADPHVWLDPTKLDVIAAAVADRLADVDPDNAAEYRDNAANLSAELTALDTEYSDGLAQCERAELVVSHAAFGYLTERYGLEQVAVSGLAPETEPDPQRMAEVSEFVTEHDVTTIFFETLVSPGVAQSIAAETGAGTAVLDPLEGLGEDADGDYFSVMRTNLDNIREALGCQ